VKLVLQRVESASVEAGGATVASIGHGILALVGIERGDDASTAARAVEKLAELRIFADPAGKMNLSAREAGAELLVVSQFTLAASLDRGRRPSFDAAAPPAEAEPLVESLIAGLRQRGFRVASGRFGAHMRVSLVNDGPVTFILEVPARL
jgi:D-aminoacyl-tRNA deacylase